MVLNKIRQNLPQAIKEGRLGLIVTNHGGNLTGLSRRLVKQGQQFEDGRFQDDKGNPVAQNLKIRLAPQKLLSRYGLKGAPQIKQDMSREAMLLRKGYGGSQAPAGAKAPLYTVRNAGIATNVKATPGPSLNSRPMGPGSS
jgi:hypothetical protein